MVDDVTQIDEVARLFKALSDQTRLRLFKLLLEQKPDNALCVGAMSHRLGVTQSATSQHLAILKAAGLVVDERRGYHVHYLINSEKVAAYREVFLGLLDIEKTSCDENCHSSTASDDNQSGCRCQCTDQSSGNHI
jgi:ArsR family transcriptional regulator